MAIYKKTYNFYSHNKIMKYLILLIVVALPY